MGQGNSNKVDAIVEEIVKNNSIFKLKSSIEQEKEKDAISKSINNALSVLNEVGKELVLQELSIDPDEKFKGFIDSAGNVDILGLTKITSGIVNFKIEEAQRNGIDLRIDAPNIFNNKKSEIITEGILSLAVLDSMIKNYENLSNDDREKITDNWENLTNRQRSDVSRKKADMLRQMAEEAENEEERQAILNFKQAEENNANIYDQLDSLPEEALDGLESQFIKEDEDAFSEFCKKNPGLSKRDRLSKYKAERDKKYERIVDSVRKEKTISQDAYDKSSEYSEMTMREQVASSPQILEMIGGLEYWESLSIDEQTSIAKDYFKNEMFVGKIESFSESRRTDFQEDLIKSQIEGLRDSGFNENEMFVGKIESFSEPRRADFQEDLIKSQIEGLRDSGFNEIEIGNALQIYLKTLRSLEDEDISDFKAWGHIQRSLNLKNYLIEDGANEKIAEILSQIDFDGKLYDILGDEKGKQEIFERLNQKIEQTKEVQQLPEDILSELQAIPIALQKINCSPEDIAKGMEAYSQMIGELTSEEINSDPQMLAEILNKAVKEIDLEGVAGDILQMMSQITFNGQISEILINCKDVFLTTLNGPLLDPRVYAVNPDQNNTNPGTLSERVDEDALKAGFEALAVDLQVADQTIIRPEELVTEEAEHSVEEQEENTGTSKKEDKKETREGTVLSKLQSFIGVYSNTEMSEVEDVGEEIISIGKEMGLILSNNPTINQEDIIIDESENDEDLTQ